MEAIRTALCCASAMLSRHVGVNGHRLEACESRYGLAVTRPQGLEPLRAELADLARRVPLALACAGGTAQIADAAGAWLMAGDPVTEAERAGWPR
jgi:hypothetical protein